MERSVNWQNSDIIVKSTDQSLKRYESRVQSPVQGPGIVETPCARSYYSSGQKTEKAYLST